MKTKLLKRIIKAAKLHAHIDSITWSYNAFRITGWSASVGYATDEDSNIYGNILCYGMNEQTFDRLVRQRFWELNKNSYYEKYKSR